jgi:hypothetical protein
LTVPKSNPNQKRDHSPNTANQTLPTANQNNKDLSNTENAIIDTAQVKKEKDNLRKKGKQLGYSNAGATGLFFK